MFTFLLTIHLLCVMLWFGAAIYERLYTVRNFYKARGTTEELIFAKIVLATEKLFMLSTAGILITGIVMTIMTGYGFFGWSWIGLKQMVAVAMLLYFGLYIAPHMKKFKQGFYTAVQNKELLNDEARKNFYKFYTALDISHIGLVINILLAIWKPPI